MIVLKKETHWVILRQAHNPALNCGMYFRKVFKGFRWYRAYQKWERESQKISLAKGCSQYKV